MARAEGPARATVAPDLELSAASLDLARPLDRPKSSQPSDHPRGDRARRADALNRRRRDVAGPSSRCAARRSLTRLASPR
jgi:hypothetical protein